MRFLVSQSIFYSHFGTSLSLFSIFFNSHKFEFQVFSPQPDTSQMENDTEPKAEKKRARDNDDNLSQREQNEDRLSNLPDCVLIHLMTFMTTRDSVRTSVLSTRWKDLWKRVPSLLLNSTGVFEFRTLAIFYKLVSKVLSLRRSSIPLQSLDFLHRGRIPPQLLIRVVRYAVSHNIEHLKLQVDCDIDMPHCLFSCRSLTSLDISVWRGHSQGLFPKSLNLTALKSLRVGNFAFCAGDSELVEPFSSCVKLETLVIRHCVISNKQIFCISNATLVSLTIHASPYEEEAYNIVLSTPNLCSFTFSGVIAQQLAASDLYSLKEVNIDVDDWAASRYLQSAFILISWLEVFANIRSLIVCSSTLKVLALIPDLLNTESPFVDNLKSLIVKVKKPSSPYQKPKRAAKSKKTQLKPPLPIPDGVVDYLIRNSRFARVTITNY